MQNYEKFLNFVTESSVYEDESDLLNAADLTK